MTDGYRRFAEWCAVLTALIGLGYPVSFAIFVNSGAKGAAWASAVASTLSGLLALPVLVAVYIVLRERQLQFVLVGLILGSSAKSPWPPAPCF